MKFVLCGLVCLIGAFGEELSTLANHEKNTLERVYGRVERHETMKPPRQAPSGRNFASTSAAAYRSVRRVDNCVFPLKIAIIQDATASFEDDIEQMQKVQLPLMLDALSASHPNSSYAIITFKDKPLSPFGIAPTAENGQYSDYCQQIDAPFASNLTALVDAYSKVHPNGGGDPSENQFGALIAASQAAEIDWSGSPLATHLVVLVTDAPPHFEGDGLDGSHGMVPASGFYENSDPAKQCIAEYYPSPHQVAHAVKSKAAYFAVSVYDPAYWNGLPGASWLWFNRFMNQTDDFAQIGANDSSDFWANLAKIIKHVEDLECEETSTLAPQPPATAPNTPPPHPETEPACEETIICDHGVEVNIGFKPDTLKVEVDGKSLV